MNFMKKSFFTFRLFFILALMSVYAKVTYSQCGVTEGIPFISNGPEQIVVCEGRPVVTSGFSITGSVNASNTKLPMTGPLVFSYYKRRDLLGTWPLAFDFVTTQTLNGPFIPGAAYSPPAPLFLSAQHPQHTGFWLVTVTNSACPGDIVVSREFTITVQTQFGITHQPKNLTICEGGSDSIVADVRGTIGFLPNSLQYIVWKNGVQVGPAKYVVSNNTLQEGVVSININNIANNNNLSNNGDVYQFKLCYPAGFGCADVGNVLYSQLCTLTVKPKTKITTQPLANSTFCTGGNFSLNVNATGTGLTYKWYKGSVISANLILGATSSTYSQALSSISDTGRYFVVVSGECGSDTSSSARLSGKIATSITSISTGRTLCSGGDVILNVVAAGENLTYQWFRGGTDSVNRINGANTTQLAILNASVTRDYFVKVTGDCGSVTSGAISITVNGNTTISNSELVNVVSCSGSDATMAVSATGVNLTYKWQKETPSGSGTFVDIVGAPTTSSITISGVVAGDAGLYRVVVSGDCGSSVNKQYRLTVLSAPTATIDLIGDGCLGAKLTLRANATGVPRDSQPALEYQWILNGVELTGSTNKDLVIDSLRLINSGNYQVKVTGKCGSVTSSASRITPNVAPAIINQPLDIASCINSSITFGVTAIGNNIKYQWQKNGTNIPGADSNIFSIGSLRNSDGGIYRVIVSNPCGSVNSNVARLDIGDSVFVKSLPQSQSVCPGSNVSFKIDAVGRSLTYVWKKNGVIIIGQTTNTLSISNVSGNDSAIYRVEVSGGCSEKVVFADASLTIKPALVTIETQPLSKSGCAGEAISFNVKVNGNPSDFTYQWRKNGVIILGANTPDYNIASLSPIDVDSSLTAQYDVVVSSPCGTSVTSSAASLKLKSIVSITYGLTNITSCAGEPVELKVITNGAIKFVWKRDGVVISGETTAVYTIPALGARTSGTYSVTISGECGGDATSQSVVTVGVAPTLLDSNKMADVTSCGGTNVTLQSKASGTNLNYIWRKDGILVPGANTSSLNLTNITTLDSGVYIVEIFNGCPTRIYDTVAVSIGGRAQISSQPTSTRACEGREARLSVVASGVASYQWKKNGTSIAGATNPELIIPTFTTSDTGNYSVVIISQCNGDTIVSNIARIDIGSVSFGTDSTSYLFTGAVGDTIEKEIRYVNTGATPVKVIGVTYQPNGPFSVIGIRPVSLDSTIAPGGEVFVKVRYIVLTGNVKDTVSVMVDGTCSQTIKTELVGKEDSSSARIPGIEIVSVRDTITKKTPTNIVIRYIGDPKNLVKSGVTSMTFEISFDAALLTPADTIYRALVRYSLDTITGRIIGILPITITPVPTMGVITSIPFAMLIGDTTSCDLKFVGKVVWTGGNVIVDELRNGVFIGDGYCTRGKLRGVKSKISLSTPIPNPANGSTKLKFSLADDGIASLKVYDAIGRIVLNKEINQIISTGDNVTENLDVSELQSGWYIIELQQGENVERTNLNVVK